MGVRIDAQGQETESEYISAITRFEDYARKKLAYPSKYPEIPTNLSFSR